MFPVGFTACTISNTSFVQSCSQGVLRDEILERRIVQIDKVIVFNERVLLSFQRILKVMPSVEFKEALGDQSDCGMQGEHVKAAASKVAMSSLYPILYKYRIPQVYSLLWPTFPTLFNPQALTTRVVSTSAKQNQNVAR